MANEFVAKRLKDEKSADDRFPRALAADTHTDTLLQLAMISGQMLYWSCYFVHRSHCINTLPVGSDTNCVGGAGTGSKPATVVVVIATWLCCTVWEVISAADQTGRSLCRRMAELSPSGAMDGMGWSRSKKTQSASGLFSLVLLISALMLLQLLPIVLA